MRGAASQLPARAIAWLETAAAHVSCTPDRQQVTDADVVWAAESDDVIVKRRPLLPSRSSSSWDRRWPRCERFFATMRESGAKELGKRVVLQLMALMWSNNLWHKLLG